MRRACALAGVALALASVGRPALAQVRAEGPGSVGIQHMSGGTINLGLTEVRLKAILKAADAAQQDRLVKGVAELLNGFFSRESSRPGPTESEFSIGVVRAFLTSVLGKQVPESEWSQEFGRLALWYYHAGTLISNTPLDGGGAPSRPVDQVGLLADRADQARRTGDLARADAFLKAAGELADIDAGLARDQIRQADRRAASLLASRASLAFARLEREPGAELLQLAFERRADDVSPETFQWLVEAGDAREGLRQPRQALALRLRACQVAQAQVDALPGDPSWLGRLADSHGQSAALQQELGELTAALASRRAGLAARSRLAQAEPGNTEAQRNLSIAFNQVGDARQALGQLVEALDSYEAGRAIRQRLVTQGSANVGLQIRSAPGHDERWRDLSVSLERIGDVQHALSRPSEALASYARSLAIREARVRADPAGADRQRELALNHDKIGDVLREQGDLGAALASYRAGLAIHRRLAAAAPDDVDGQVDLAVLLYNLSRLGDVAGTSTERRQWLQEATLLLRAQRDQGRLPDASLDWIPVFEGAMAAL